MYLKMAKKFFSAIYLFLTKLNIKRIAKRFSNFRDLGIKRFHCNIQVIKILANEGNHMCSLMAANFMYMTINYIRVFTKKQTDIDH